MKAMVAAETGDELARAASAAGESATAAECLQLARGFERAGDPHEALRWALAVPDTTDDFTSWQAAAAIAARTASAYGDVRRTARLALVGSYTTSQLATMLRLAALREGIALEIYESPFGQYRQEVLDARSAMYAFSPDVIVVAVHDRDLALPQHSAAPAEDLSNEAERWHSLWHAVASRSSATVVQHLFAIPPEAPFGHLGATLPGARPALIQKLNADLAASCPDHVAVVDCDRLAALIGKRRWFDARYWHFAKQGVALDALPLLARHTVAVVAARLGLTRKCLVLDLDNTLWGGIVGEDGLDGLRLGDTAEGEAFQAFQESILTLKNRGVVLAVCSKNNEADAKEVFERHPSMRIALDDIAVFVADWRPKPEQLRTVAAELDIGLDALVFVDDNPVEREAVRQLLPEVDVIRLPDEPADFVQALSDYLLFEPASFTHEDARRTELYRGRAAARQASTTAESLEDFFRSLEMHATISPFTSANLPRVAQLVGKTNQFNLTTRRHSAATLASFVADDACVHRTFTLADKFTHHGLVGLVIAFAKGETLEVDTWLMSCRVIGRTLEQTVLDELVDCARERCCTTIIGTYEPTQKNALVADLYAKLGFTPLSQDAERRRWSYDVAAHGTRNEFIEVETAQEDNDAAA